VAALIRQGVETVLEREMEPSSEEVVRRAIRAAGSFRSSRHDVALHHDDYLDQAYSE